MKKVKIMLMSLALLAVVGGALAFKAKLSGQAFCTTNAYYAQTLGYYCAFAQLGSGEFTTIDPTITKACNNFLQNSTSDPFADDLVKKVCTTTLAGVDNNAKCQTLTCPIRITTVRE